MKLEIMGFSQQGLMDLGLGVEDAMLLRWFIDYQNTRKMKMISGPDGKVYFWVNMKKVCEDLPVLTKSEKWISQKFNRLVSAGILLKQETFEGRGRMSCFRINDEAYLQLVDLNVDSMSVKTDIENKVNVSKNGHVMSVKTDIAHRETNDLPRNNNTGDNPLRINDCSEVPKNGTPSQSPAVLQIPLNDKTTYGVTDAQIKKWTELYPAVDVMQQLRQMIGWCDGNPKRCKTRTGVLRFINSWLSREQDRGGKRSTAPSSSRTMVNNSVFDNQQGGETIW